MKKYNVSFRLSDEGLTDRTQKWLKVLRYSLGLSSKEFANIIGMTRQSINNYESGRTKLPKATCCAILYGVEDLLHGYTAGLPFKVLNGLIYDNYIFESEEKKVRFVLEIRSLVFLYWVDALTEEDLVDQLEVIFSGDEWYGEIKFKS